MTIKHNLSRALLRFAFYVISWNAPRLVSKYPRLALFSFDYVGNYINVFGSYEYPLFAKLRQILAQQRVASTALDIGANIGVHTVFYSEMFANVIALEPNPKTYSLLKINTAHLSNVKCIMMGASSKNESCPLIIDNTNLGDARIKLSPIAALANTHSACKISVMPIDDINEIRNSSIGFVKIDVQGHELKVLSGMVNTLRQNTPIILFEQEASEFVGRSTPTVDLLKTLGYKYFYGIDGRPSMVSKSLPSLLRIPLELLEIVLRGDCIETIGFREITAFSTPQANIVASVNKLL